MPRFFFAFKWADYARVPLLCVVCTVQRAGMGRIRIGKVAKGEREGGAWQQNIYTLRIADYAANLARWMRPPCSKLFPSGLCIMWLVGIGEVFQELAVLKFPNFTN